MKHSILRLIVSAVGAFALSSAICAAVVEIPDPPCEGCEFWTDEWDWPLNPGAAANGMDMRVTVVGASGACINSGGGACLQRHACTAHMVVDYKTNIAGNIDVTLPGAGQIYVHPAPPTGGAWAHAFIVGPVPLDCGTPMFGLNITLLCTDEDGEQHGVFVTEFFECKPCAWRDPDGDATEE